MAIEFWGEIDRQEKTGKIRSEYPSWYNDYYNDELKESISSMERRLNEGVIDPTQVYVTQENLKRDKERYKKTSKRPRSTPQQKDNLKTVLGSVGEKITDSMFDSSQMWDSDTSPHEEARRMTENCIKLQDDEAKLIHDSGIPIGSDKMISRNALSRFWKIGRKFLGENSNVEELRKKNVHYDRNYIRR